jgi:hypothetical protein
VETEFLEAMRRAALPENLPSETQMGPRYWLTAEEEESVHQSWENLHFPVLVAEAAGRSTMASAETAAVER